MGNFKSDVKRGIKWTTLATISNSLVKLFQISILTRFLLKEDFGTVAIATLFIGFTDLFSDMGMSVAIMHRQNITKNEYSSLFWLNVMSGLFLTIVLFSIAPLVSYAYSDPSLTNIIQLLSLNIFFSSLGLQHQVVQRKKLNFKFISSIQILMSVLTMFVAVILAVLDFRVYSLVYSTLFTVIATNLIYLCYGLVKDSNITFHFRFRETLSFLKIGTYKIGSSMCDYFSRELDTIIISATLGKETLGLYTLCKKIVVMSYNITSRILTSVLTPVFASMQGNMDNLTEKFLQLTKILTITNYPVFGLIAMASPVILQVLYGPDFIDGKWVLAFMACTYGQLSTGSLVGSLQVALGRTDLGFYWTIYRIISTSIAIYIGSFWDIEGITLAVLILTIINKLPSWRLYIKPMLNVSLIKFIAQQYVSFILNAILLIVLGAVVYNYTSMITAIGCGIVYVLIYYTILHLIKYDKLVFSIFKK